MTSEIILASASPRRREILERLGLAFRIHPAQVEEIESIDTSPVDMVVENARLKSEAVAAIFPDNIVLGADTSVFLDRRALNKPKTLEEASFMLGQLSGKQHTVLTGLCLTWKGRARRWCGSVRSEVVFKPLGWEDVRAYFEKVNPLDKAGAYGIQEDGDRLIASYSGSYTNIMGLPIEETAAALESFGLAVAARNKQ